MTKNGIFYEVVDFSKKSSGISKPPSRMMSSNFASDQRARQKLASLEDFNNDPNNNQSTTFYENETIRADESNYYARFGDANYTTTKAATPKKRWPRKIRGFNSFVLEFFKVMNEVGQTVPLDDNKENDGIAINPPEITFWAYGIRLEYRIFLHMRF